jgi:hypothetical protein
MREDHNKDASFVSVAGARFGWPAALWAVALLLAFDIGVALFLG